MGPPSNISLSESVTPSAVQHVTTQSSHHFIGPENTSRSFIGPENKQTTPQTTVGPSHFYPSQDRLSSSPHLPLTKDLEIRHDGEPTPVRHQTHVQVTELPFYHSTAFTTETGQQGQARQYHQIERGPPRQRQNNRRADTANMENGHSYFKLSSPSPSPAPSVTNIKVDFTQRELRKNYAQKIKEKREKKLSIFNVIKDNDENIQEYEDYENLIKQGTMTEFLKL